MSGTIERLILMANQIALNLATEPDPAAATSEHILKYWDPRMKAMIRDHLAQGGRGLSVDAREAVAKLPS